MYFYLLRIRINYLADLRAKFLAHLNFKYTSNERRWREMLARSKYNMK